MATELDPLFVQVIYQIVGNRDDFFNRSITISQYRAGGFGVVGAVITIDGIPPKVTIYVPFHKDFVICLFGSEPFILDKYKSETENQYETIMLYLKSKGVTKSIINSTS